MTRSIHRAIVALLVLLSMLLAVPAGVAAQGNPNAPYKEEVDESFPAPNLTAQCGFDVTAHVYGTLTIKAHPSRGDRVQFRYTHTFIGPDGSFAVNRVENAWISITFLPDGKDIEYVTASGRLMYHNVLPGVGSIGNNSGREVFEVTWAFDEEAVVVCGRSCVLPRFGAERRALRRGLRADLRPPPLTPAWPATWRA